MKPKTAAKSDSSHPKRQNESTRERVLEAAFTLFCEHRFSDVSMLEIATRAQVSKRDLYALFRNKQAVLADCIKERAQRLRGPLDEADQAPKNREALAATLVEIGVSILKGVCQPEVLTVYRLTIAESDRAPEIARLLGRPGAALAKLNSFWMDSLIKTHQWPGRRGIDPSYAHGSASAPLVGNFTTSLIPP